jgi:RNA polymerase sporulation-specific sigma factor
MLSDKELRSLIKKAQRGSVAQKQTAVNLITEHNLNLVRSIIARFTGRGYERDDLFQIGSIGLLKSIERFDLTMNVKFSTYAVPMIIGEIKRFMRDDNSIKISRPLKELAFKIYKTREDLEKQTGSEPKISEIAQVLSLSKEEIAAALEAVKPQISLYETSYSDNKGGEIYLLDQLSKDNGKDGAFIDKIALKQALGKLPARERKIIFLRFFADKTQSDIAKIIGLSQVQVSRLEKDALKKIRSSFADELK